MGVTTVVLPDVIEVDSIDENVGRLLSDLDSLARRVERFDNAVVSLDDAAFMTKAGVTLGSEHRCVDPGRIARLLVFANELEEDGESIKVEAARLRDALLRCYRELVIEDPLGKAARDA